MPSAAMDMEALTLNLAGAVKKLKTVECSSTDATELYFARPGKDDRDVDAFLAAQPCFQPTFTYPFFGQEELFKGVEEASLRICYDPSTFFAYISFEVDEDADDLRDQLLAKLTALLPKDSWTEDWDQFIQMTHEPLGDLGTLKSSFELNGTAFSIYKCSFEDQQFRAFHSRLQTLLLFFIEASSYIDDSDTKWNVYAMLEACKQGPQRLVGYTTLYPFLFYPDKIRMRLSQFLVLPSHHRLGLGSHLYRHVYKGIVDDEDIKEMVVEDPSEEFSVFRLHNDYAVFSALAEEPDRHLLKYSALEFELLQQLSLFKKLNFDAQDKEFRMLVKKAIWRRNKDSMPEDTDEMKEYLQELYDDRIALFKKAFKVPL